MLEAGQRHLLEQLRVGGERDLGPVEATAIGNILIQAIADGQLSSLDDLRKTVGGSFPVEEFLPSGKPEWVEAFERFEKIRK